ncbi:MULTISPECIES: FKBP-type peptidyl-prolyl cis-trans isomerase [Nonlabens]|uniref:Peptidyl-prolyl cis-trans isomerase n=1 Tax=Nonlabens ulvanivorans TaxID=906888 RepID=A0A081D918_NONUL|nr:peptidylprolyl isomerase [Nonlabens ulvanivorans]KEZ94372.1 peptidylprolyl isomerase [Nonlabens ulvanivorans]PRX12263.1 FKBP-type peptidyl-prolyl cis-trans isomerase 2 [Nonlabens ulvanivorans]GAK75414.1 FKBP-type peptidyl-prolyl cis-trans isomeraseSlyD [Nonlabens ulvanivorans]GAL01776.1 FKBP-type peptidyl-prolyl cis-trans isomerase SlyD [Nonlabens ulvanivorans]GAL75865.1 FKBP-type peptidyl-prolyl cis-trans isomerase SlyD [Nonlabens ulvanivorans]
MSQVKANDTVKVHYTGKLKATGQVFDTSADREPLEAQLGQGMLIPGFENGLIDMKVNEKKTIEIPKEEAYGEVMEELFHKVDRTQLPQEVQPEVGMGLISQNPDGTERQLRVAEVQEDHIVVDANHPLAGQDLVFELELVGIN